MFLCPESGPPFFFPINPFPFEWVLRALIDFTLSNARRFYSSMGNLSDGKGLNFWGCLLPEWYIQGSILDSIERLILVNSMKYKRNFTKTVKWATTSILIFYTTFAHNASCQNYVKFAYFGYIKIPSPAEPICPSQYQEKLV